MKKQHTKKQHTKKQHTKKQHMSKQLLSMLALSGLAFLLTGFTIQRFAAPPSMTLLIDRSYCPATQWQTLTDKYTQLYQRHQRQQIEIESVVLFSDLSQTTLDTIPTPRDLKILKTYGHANPQAQQSLLESYRNAQLLNCESTAP